MILVVLAVLAALFLGLVTFIGKSMKSEGWESDDSEKEQSERAEEIWKKKKMLMEEREMQMRTRK